MNDYNEPLSCDTEVVETRSAETLLTTNLPDQDDRYPGSFFRISGKPITGKTTWSLC